MVLLRVLRWFLWVCVLLSVGVLVASSGHAWAMFAYLWVLGAVVIAAAGLLIRHVHGADQRL